MRIARLGGLFVLFLITAALWTIAPRAQAQDGTLAPTPDPVYLTGRVVDSEGEPIAGVELYAMPSCLTDTLAMALMPGSRYENTVWGAATDEQGAFSIPVAFPGVVYRVGARYSSTATFSTQEMIADPDATIEIEARRLVRRPTIEGQVLRRDGSVAAGATVELVGRYLGQRWTRQCDAYGRFRFDDLYVKQWDSGMLYASLDGEVSQPYSDSRLRAVNGRVHLGMPATAVGVLRDENTGRPIAGATIIVAPRRYPQIQWTATTHDDGWFQVLDLPPGEFQYRAVCDSHADQPPSVRRWDSRRVELAPGATVELEGFRMARRALLAGRVVDADGQPVAGALVGCPCHAGDTSSAVDAVYTDAAGRFELHPAVNGLSYLRYIYAYHPAAGAGNTRIEVFLPDPQRTTLEPGMALTDFEIILGGSSRVRGRVTGPDGEPIVGVRCLYLGSSISTVTDDEGRYDLGLVPLSPGNGHGGLRAVRTLARGVVTEASYNRWPRRVYRPEARHYITGQTQGEPGPDGETAVDLRLERTDVLTFAGRVNRPVAWGEDGPKVYLIHGRIEGDAARDSVLSFLKVLRRQNEMLRTHGYIGELPIDHDICVFATARSDKDGRWSAHFTRHGLDTWVQRADRIRLHELTEDERMLIDLGIELDAVLGEDRAQDVEQRAQAEAEAEAEAESEPAMRWVTALVVLGEMEYELHEPIELRADKLDYSDPALGVVDAGEMP